MSQINRRGEQLFPIRRVPKCATRYCKGLYVVQDLGFITAKWGPRNCRAGHVNHGDLTPESELTDRLPVTALLQYQHRRSRSRSGCRPWRKRCCFCWSSLTVRRLLVLWVPFINLTLRCRDGNRASSRAFPLRNEINLLANIIPSSLSCNIISSNHNLGPEELTTKFNRAWCYTWIVFWPSETERS